MNVFHYWHNKRNNQCFHAIQTFDSILAFLRSKTLSEVEALKYSPLTQPLHYRAIYLRRFELTGQYPRVVYFPEDYPYIEAYIREQTSINGHLPRLSLAVSLSVLGPKSGFFDDIHIEQAFREHYIHNRWTKTFFHHAGFSPAHIHAWFDLTMRFHDKWYFIKSYILQELKMLHHTYSLNKEHQIRFGLLCLALGADARLLFVHYYEPSLWDILTLLPEEERYAILSDKQDSDGLQEDILWL